VLLVVVGACRGHAATPPAEPLSIPTTTGPIKIDGEWDEPDWSKRALRGQFLGDDGQLSRPSSEIRLLHDAGHVYVGLYAADDNIQSTDAFVVKLGGHQWTVYATGKSDPAVEAGALAIDKDGTLDDPSNHDEEWIVELALPIAATGIAATGPTAVAASRCDTPLEQPQRCTAWSGEVRLQ
jgi:hypothetical protein